MKHYILYNPLAGNGDAEQKVLALKDMYGEDTECINVIEMRDYRAFAQALSPDDVIVICGGDGTINHFINDTEVVEIKNDVLYFPTGTGNDFVRDVCDVDASKPFSIRKRYAFSPPTMAWHKVGSANCSLRPISCRRQAAISTS